MKEYTDAYERMHSVPQTGSLGERGKTDELDCFMRALETAGIMTGWSKFMEENDAGEIHGQDKT